MIGRVRVLGRHSKEIDLESSIHNRLYCHLEFRQMTAQPGWELTQSGHARSIRRMFGQIAPGYDVMNRLMSAGQDLRWRRAAIQAADLRPGDRFLDVATGTGDLVFLAQSAVPDLRTYAVDFAPRMLQVGKSRSDTAAGHGCSNWIAADTYLLPFDRNQFHAVVSGFLLRNLTDPLAAIQEQTRVLRPGRRLVMLDATPPPQNALQPFINFYLHTVIPLLGRLVARHAGAYRYLPRSVAAFLHPEAIAALFEQAGLVNIHHRSFLSGVSALVMGTKPDAGVQNDG